MLWEMGREEGAKQTGVGAGKRLLEELRWKMMSRWIKMVAVGMEGERGRLMRL